MRFKKNQPIQVAPGWHDAGRKGIHLATVEYDGRTWHIVQLRGDKSPSLLMLGTIQPVKPLRVEDDNSLILG